MGFNFHYKERKIEKPVNYAPGKRNMSKIYWYILLALILSPFVYLGYTIFTDAYFMTASGHVTFGEITLRSPASAYVKKIWLIPGESFKENQKIIELYSPQLTAQQQALRAEINLLKKQRSEFFYDDAELGKLQLAKAASQKYMQECQSYLDSMKTILAQGASTVLQVETARNDLNSAQQQYYATEAAIARLGTTKSLQSVEFFDKNILDTEAKLRALDTSISLLSVSVPESGSLAKLFIQDYEYVKEGQDIAKIVVRKDIYIVAYIEAKFLSAKLTAGQSVRIRFPDGTSVKGTLSSNPVMAEIDPARSGIVSNAKNKIIIRIVPAEPVPDRYKIADLPVDVLFY